MYNYLTLNKAITPACGATIHSAKSSGPSIEPCGKPNPKDLEQEFDDLIRTGRLRSTISKM